MATNEQLQKAASRAVAARKAFDAVRGDYRARFYPKGGGGRVGYGDRGMSDYEAMKNTPEAGEYEAAEKELDRLQREAMKERDHGDHH